MLGSILGRWEGLWLQASKKTVIAVTQEKHLLFLFFDLFCRFFWILFFFFLFPFPLSVVVVNFIGTMKSNEALKDYFFFLRHIFYCCYKPPSLCWAFEVLWSFSFFLFPFFILFSILIFKNYYIFSTFIMLIAFPMFFSPSVNL